LFQLLHHLSIGTTIQFPNQNHRNKNEPYNEPQNPVPTTTIQNKQQNLKNQIKPKEPEDLKRESKIPPPNNIHLNPVIGGSQKRIEGILCT
jgi:hypothetical protein